LMAPIGVDLCAAYAIAGEYSKIVEVAPKVLALLEKTRRESESFSGGFNAYSQLLVEYGWAMGWLGRFKEGQAQCEKGLRFAYGINDLYSIGWGEFMYGFVFAVWGHGENAVEHFQKAVSYAEKAEFVAISGITQGAIGWGYYLLGELETARQHAERAIKIQNDVGIPYGLSLSYWILGMVHLDWDDLKSAQSYTEEALKLSQNNNEKQLEGVSRLFLGRILGKAEESQYGKAKECILQGIKIFDKLKLKPFVSQGYLYLGELYADTGQTEKALETLKKAESAFQKMGMDYWLQRTQEVLERVEG